MRQISFKRHRFPPDVIRYAVWLYYRFTMSLRDVEDLLAERGIDVTYETVRCWANKFGPAFRLHPLRDLQRLRRPASPRLPKDPAQLSSRRRDGMACCVSSNHLILDDQPSS